MTNASTADYPIHEETITRVCPFGHNELVEILDAQGKPTGKRAYFVAEEVDMFYQPTGKGHVATVGGPNIGVPYKQLRSVKH